MGRQSVQREGGGNLSRVAIFVSVVVTVSLLTYVATVAGAARDSGEELVTIIRRTWLIILLLTVPYLAARAFVWDRLLKQLGIDVPRHQMLLSFAVGEITKYLPAGIYVENYVLARLARFDRSALVRSALATTGLLGLEAALSLAIVLIVGIPQVPWLVPTLLALVGAWLAVLGLVWTVVHFWALHLRQGTPRWLRHALAVAVESLGDGRRLLAPATASLLAPAAIYMVSRIIDLYVIIIALGVHTISFAQVAAVYGVVVLGVILIPLPTELGFMEITGLEAFVAAGLSPGAAALVMLSQRLLASGMTILLAGVLVMSLRAPSAIEALLDRLSSPRS